MRYSVMLIPILAALGISGLASAYGLGTSSIQFQHGNVSIYSNGTVYANYSINLSSGSTWGSTLNLTNAVYLQSKGISITLSAAAGDPTFGGYAQITTKGTLPGRYNAIMSVTGDDPSNAYSLGILVLGGAGNSSAQPKPPQAPSSTSTLYYIAGAVLLAALVSGFFISKLSIWS
ncbi:MAG: hypothetical protein ACYCO0_03425 [Candidatus Micrarchaeaceae archaeon]